MRGRPAILNKRKAVIGWTAYTVGKPIAKRVMRSKARAVVPRRSSGSRARKARIPAALLAAGGAFAGVLFFWRKRRSEETPES